MFFKKSEHASNFLIDFLQSLTENTLAGGCKNKLAKKYSRLAPRGQRPGPEKIRTEAQRKGEKP